MSSPTCEICGGSHPTEVHAGQLEGKESKESREHAKRGIDYLAELLASDGFRAEYVEATSENALRKDPEGVAAESNLKKEQDAITAEVQKRLKAKEGVAEEKALETVRAAGIEAATALDVKKQMRDPKVREIWGPALAAAKQELESTNAQIEIDGQVYGYNDFDAAVAQEVTEAHAEALAGKEQTLEALRAKFEAEAGLQLEHLHAELEARSEDPALLTALDVWGMAPDSLGERGSDGQGFHAGIAHFFEYRRSKEKLKRFSTEPTIDNFIEFSTMLKGIINEPDPSKNSDVIQTVYIKDDQGQSRLMSLVNRENGLMVSAFQRQGEPMRVITAISPYQEKQFSKDVDKELHPKDYIKLNELGENRTQVELSQYAS